MAQCFVFAGKTLGLDVKQASGRVYTAAKNRLAFEEILLTLPLLIQDHLPEHGGPNTLSKVN